MVITLAHTGRRVQMIKNGGIRSKALKKTGSAGMNERRLVR
jgi:hypothetical protein